MRFGSIDVPLGLCLAPMEDVTDGAFRLICRRLGAEVVYTEFVSSEGLIRNSVRAERKMTLCPEERPVGIQLYGPDIDHMASAAQLVEAMKPDFIDINCGCWVRNVAMQGSGAGLLRDLPRMEQIARRVVGAVRLPVTLKTRLGWDTRSIRIVDVARMCEQAGIAALAIHCRTREQGHDGPPDYSWIAQVKQAVSIPIIVNGSIASPEDARKVFSETGCDGIMIGRGALRNPWIFGQIRAHLQTGERAPEPTFVERIELLAEHLRLSRAIHGDRFAAIRLRKHYAGYLHGVPGGARLRAELMHFSQASELADYLARLNVQNPGLSALSDYYAPSSIQPQDGSLGLRNCR